MYLPEKLYRRLRGPRTARRERRDNHFTPGLCTAHAAHNQTFRRDSGPVFAQKGMPLQLLHKLGAQCPLCQGLGCGECASSGLR